ncbi:MAG: ECF transporter S component [Acutalibacteraceae bacterium]|nr:ECF transporter S component [Acutalibacteraceae bacterium]
MNKIKLRSLCVTAIMGAVGTVLMYLEFAVPFMPSFIKVDFSELPALITSFALGPVWGILVCFIKNLLHLFVSDSMWIGELSNFILGAIFVGVAGVIYQHRKTRTSALISCLAGAIVMAVISLPSNYYIIYPFYGEAFGLTSDIIISMYKSIFGGVTNLWECLIIFNLPFNFLKGIVNAFICFMTYKKISPLLQGKLR